MRVIPRCCRRGSCLGRRRVASPGSWTTRLVGRRPVAGAIIRLCRQMALELLPSYTRAFSVTPNIIEILGGRQVFGARAARVDLLEEVERGLPMRAYEAVTEALELTPVEEDRLLRVSLRTRARWKKRARLDAATSDRLVRLARVLALAVLVLESRGNAVAWLREPSEALGGRSPLAAIASDPGAEKVSNMLYQMEHGIYA